MPESYTHICLASEALTRSGNTAANRAAFMAGASGPNALYAYRLRKKNRRPNLPALAALMHREKTGAFLEALIDGATTPAQQSYVLGFIAHYTADCTLNPYLAAMSAPGRPYAMPGGRWLMAAGLDSALYHRDYNTRRVPPHAAAPVLLGAGLAQVCALLREALSRVYDKRIPLLALADAFHDNFTLHRRLYSRGPLKGAILAAMDDDAVAKDAGPLRLRRLPAQALRTLPQHWKNPFSGEEMDLTLDEVLGLAQQTGAICITAAMRYWLGELDAERLRAVLGNNEYATGLPAAPPAEETAALPAQEAAADESPLPGGQTA